MEKKTSRRKSPEKKTPAKKADSKPVEEYTTNALDWDSCPVCKSSWVGGKIIDTFKKYRNEGSPFYKDKTDAELQKIVEDSYCPPYVWKKCIGIEIQGEYDGILYVQCPSCKSTFHRFTGKPVDTNFDASSKK